jgi:P27 family predicted phage terminase small subunit
MECSNDRGEDQISTDSTSRTVGRSHAQEMKVIRMKNFAPKPPRLQKPGPKPPSSLSSEAKRWWRKIVAGWELDDAGFLVLESALECFDRMRQAQAMLEKEGLIAKDRFGQDKVHPAVLVERDAKAGLLRALRAMNLQIEPLHDTVGRPAGT